MIRNSLENKEEILNINIKLANLIKSSRVIVVDVAINLKKKKK